MASSNYQPTAAEEKQGVTIGCLVVMLCTALAIVYMKKSDALQTSGRAVPLPQAGDTIDPTKPHHYADGYYTSPTMFPPGATRVVYLGAGWFEYVWRGCWVLHSPHSKRGTLTTLPTDKGQDHDQRALPVHQGNP